MPRVLAEALRKREREWGAENARILAALRADKLPSRYFPSRPQHAIGDGGYVTHIPGR